MNVGLHFFKQVTARLSIEHFICGTGEFNKPECARFQAPEV